MFSVVAFLQLLPYEPRSPTATVHVLHYWKDDLLKWPYNFFLPSLKLFDNSYLAWKTNSKRIWFWLLPPSQLNFSLNGSCGQSSSHILNCLQFPKHTRSFQTCSLYSHCPFSLSLLPAVPLISQELGTSSSRNPFLLSGTSSPWLMPTLPVPFNNLPAPRE